MNLPHLAAPFTLTNKGAKVNEQGSPQDVAANVYNICVCETGAREERPEFGIRPLLFAPIPLDMDALAEQVERWEPRASVEAIAEAERMIAAQQRIRLEVAS